MRKLSSVAPFADVPSGFWAAAAINQLASQGILGGVGGGLFDPNQPVTRAEFAAMLDRLYKVPSTTIGPPFSDVSATDWYYADVEGVAGNEWMDGVGGGLFDPEGTLTRAEAAATVLRAIGLDHVATDEGGLPLPYTDASAVPGYASGAVLACLHLGLMNGVGGGAFAPNAAVTRAQAAVLLSRMQAVRPDQIAAEAARVTATVVIDPSSGTTIPGAPVTLYAYAHDATGYILPADFTWKASGGTLTANGTSATWTAAAAGSFTVTSQVAGGSVTRTAIITVDPAAALTVSGMPPVEVAGQPLAVALSLLDGSGQVDTGATGVTASVTLRPIGCAATCPAPHSAQAFFQQGRATATLPALSAGSYMYTIGADGVQAVTGSLLVVAQPLGAITLTGQTAPVAGSQDDVRVTLPADAPAGNWPLSATETGTAVSLPPIPDEPQPPSPLQIGSGPATIPPTGGVVPVLATAPGSGTVTVSVPGGAFTPAALPVNIRPSGSFGQAETSPSTVEADHATTLRIPIAPSAGTTATPTVQVEPIDPAGHPLNRITTTVSGGVAQATFVPQGAGTWSFRWFSAGYDPVQSGALQVTAGPATHLVVDPHPTSVVLVGSQATLTAWVADQYGNPVSTPFQLQTTVQGTAGTVTIAASALTSPATAATFTATTPGTTTVTFRTPTYPQFAPVTVTLRTITQPTDRVAGKGLWLTYPVWRDTPDSQLLQTALQDGVTHIYLEVATTSDGFYGGLGLDDFLAKAHADGIAVIAWIYAGLEDPAHDAQLLREVAAYTTPTGDRPDGVALDLEEVMTPSVISAYASLAHTLEGPDGLVVAVTYPPQFRPDYPFAALAGLAQVFAPMDYWAITESTDYTYARVYKFVADSIATIRQDTGEPNVPVEVISEAFDWFASGGTGIFSPSPLAMAASIRAASDGGAIGVSFYRYSTWTPDEAQVIASYPWPDQ